jgi:hypothetical protein
LSPVWRIWNEKNEVYLTGKVFNGTFKISLHSSGVWPVAATDESGIDAKPGNRRMKAWKRPPEFQPGWTQGPHISVARLPQYDHGKFDERQSKPIDWIPKPDPNWKATVAVFFGASDKTLHDFTQILAPREMYLDDHLELANGQKVFVMARYDPLTNDDAPTVNLLRSYADEFFALNDSLVGCFAIFMQAPPIPWVYHLKVVSPPKLWLADQQ